MNAARRALALLLLAAATSACGRDAVPLPPAGPEEAALELFRIARAGELRPERVEALFGAERDERRRAALLDALERVGQAAGARVVRVEALDRPAGAVVDVAAELPGGGEARFSVQALSSPVGWRVTWFQGPGVEWPPPRPRPGGGLSTSPPPDA